MNADNAHIPVHYFVYFRIRVDTDHDEAQTRIRAMQEALAAQTGVVGRLMCRSDDDKTWMETYESVSDSTGFELALQREVATSGILELIEPGSARHIERFVECV